MSHPYRLQLSQNNGDSTNASVECPPARPLSIQPHHIMASQNLATNKKKPHPFLQQLPPSLSKSVESLHLSSPRSRSFASSIRGSTTSSSPNRSSSPNKSSRSTTLHSSRPTNSIRALLVENTTSNFYTSDKSSSSNSASSNDIINTATTIQKNKSETPAIPEIPLNDSELETKEWIDESSNSITITNTNPPSNGNNNISIRMVDESQHQNDNDNNNSNFTSPSSKGSNDDGTPDKYTFQTATNNSSSNSPRLPQIDTPDSDITPELPSELTPPISLSEKVNNEQINSDSDVDSPKFGNHNKTKSVMNILHPVFNNIDSDDNNPSEINTNPPNETLENLIGTVGSSSSVQSADVSPQIPSIPSIPSSSNVSLLPMGTSIEMYRKNAKKSKDPETLFTFAQILIKTALTKRSDSPLTVKEKEKYLDEAYTALKKSSKSGFIEAQYYLGDAFSVGLFSKGKPDLSKSLTYFEAAAKSRHAESSYRTAMCYKKGWGCTRDARKVIKYLEIAALNNHPVAMMEYGIYAFHGLMSLPEDVNTKKKGINWLKRATESVTELSCGAPYELALIYLNGFKDIVIKDTNYAIKLLFKASSLGHAKSATMLGKFYEIGDIVEPNSDLSIHFYNMAANLGDVEGMMGLCSWYFVGSEHLPQDYDEAFAWASRAAENFQHIKAMLLLERFYSLGLGCEKDINKSKHWGDLARKLENEQKKDKRKEKKK